jgi:hypothetical protein
MIDNSFILAKISSFLSSRKKIRQETDFHRRLDSYTIMSLEERIQAYLHDIYSLVLCKTPTAKFPMFLCRTIFS